MKMAHQPATARPRRPRRRVAVAVAGVVAVAVAAPLGASALAGGPSPKHDTRKDALVARALGHTPAPAPRPSVQARSAAAPSSAAPPAPAHDGQIGSQAALGGVPVPFPASYFHVTNLWQSRRAGHYVSVYAGALARDPSHGVVLAASDDPATGQTTVKRYDAPRAGALKLTRASAGVVRFGTARGHALGAFEVGPRRFVAGR